MEPDGDCGGLLWPRILSKPIIVFVFTNGFDRLGLSLLDRGFCGLKIFSKINIFLDPCFYFMESSALGSITISLGFLPKSNYFLKKDISSSESYLGVYFE